LRYIANMDLRDKVRAAYSSVAEQPEAPHPFRVGREFATSLGYPSEWLNQIPDDSLEAFTGVSNVPCFAEIPPGRTVLDVGCGAGLDSLLLARRAGTGGKVIGVDFSWAMLERAHRAATASGVQNVLFCQADAERLPLGDGAIDAAVVNGLFNLNPARGAIIVELARCIRPGGRVYGAELFLRVPLAPEVKASEANWFA
jgi:arsenite methyltransferase